MGYLIFYGAILGSLTLYLMIGLFIERLLEGDVADNSSLWIVTLWPIIIVGLLFIAVFEIPIKLADWIREKEK